MGGVHFESLFFFSFSLFLFPLLNMAIQRPGYGPSKMALLNILSNNHLLPAVCLDKN